MKVSRDSIPLLPVGAAQSSSDTTESVVTVAASRTLTTPPAQPKWKARVWKVLAIAAIAAAVAAFIYAIHVTGCPSGQEYLGRINDPMDCSCQVPSNMTASYCWRPR